MKIALLFPNNIFTSPYLKYYTQILQEENISYDLIIWDRASVSEENTIAFRTNQQSSVFSKTFNFLRFRSFIIRRLNEKKYSKVIVFSCQLGILLSNYLGKKYPKKYILDIRDYSTVIPYFKNHFDKLLSNANFICISSYGFKEWLPTKLSYVMSHNVDIKLVEERLKTNYIDENFLNNDRINVDTIGQIKDFESDKKFVDVLKNDSNFKMQFIGFGPTVSQLKYYVTENNILNASFYGSYDKDNEKYLLKNTEFINILISCNKFNNGVTSNRLYLSSLLNIPCLVNYYSTEQRRIIEKYGFGIVIENYEDLPKKLIKYKENFNKERFVNNCTAYLNDVKKDYEIFKNKLINFIIEK